MGKIKLNDGLLTIMSSRKTEYDIDKILKLGKLNFIYDYYYPDVENPYNDFKLRKELVEDILKNWKIFREELSYIYYTREEAKILDFKLLRETRFKINSSNEYEYDIDSEKYFIDVPENLFDKVIEITEIKTTTMLKTIFDAYKKYNNNLETELKDI